MQDGKEIMILTHRKFLILYINIKKLLTKNYRVASSPTGWTDAELGYLWLSKHFEPITMKKLVRKDNYRLLILDGHTSHCSLQFLAAAEKTRIIILCLPSHTTHVLQPCDVGVFSPLATFYKKEVI